MKENTILLNYYQVMTLLNKIKTIKQKDESFSSDIVYEFEKYALERTTEIAIDKKVFSFKGRSNKEDYEISEETFNYIVNLTGINPFDRGAVSKKDVKKMEKEALQNFIDSDNAKKDPQI